MKKILDRKFSLSDQKCTGGVRFGAGAPTNQYSLLLYVTRTVDKRRQRKHRTGNKGARSNPVSENASTLDS